MFHMNLPGWGVGKAATNADTQANAIALSEK